MRADPQADLRMRTLVPAIQELSLARNLGAVMRVVRRVARELTGADGATFVLKDDGKCFYADEDAIEPLWKGLRFPMEACISGWAMIHREPVIIPDIYADARVPADAYRPTFVKSLAMVPIRTQDPIGAIGNYWASNRTVTEEELELLQALANSTSIAMENVRVMEELEARVRARTAQLEAANRELEAFSYSVSHDLRAPLRSIDGFGKALEEDVGDTLDPSARDHLKRIRVATARMGGLIEEMLELAKVSRGDLRPQKIDVSDLARSIADDLRRQEPERQVEIVIADDLVAHGDPSLLRAVLENLLGNAFKFTSRVPDAKIELFARVEGNDYIYVVRDNGAGFNMKYANKLFAPFQRLHSEAEFPGTGVGLATVQRIIHRHGGRIWAEGTPGAGATFSFTLGLPEPVSAPPR